MTNAAESRRLVRRLWVFVMVSIVQVSIATITHYWNPQSTPTSLQSEIHSHKTLVSPEINRTSRCMECHWLPKSKFIPQTNEVWTSNNSTFEVRNLKAAVYSASAVVRLGRNQWFPILQRRIEQKLVHCHAHP